MLKVRCGPGGGTMSANAVSKYTCVERMYSEPDTTAKAATAR